MKRTDAAIKNLEVQIGQLAELVAKKPTETFAVNAEMKPKEDCKVIFTERGQEGLYKGSHNTGWGTKFKFSSSLPSPFKKNKCTAPPAPPETSEKASACSYVEAKKDGEIGWHTFRQWGWRNPLHAFRQPGWQHPCDAWHAFLHGGKA